MTSRLGRGCRVALGVAMLLTSLATGASGDVARPWPPLLGSREAFSPDLSEAVDRVWIEPTLSRTVRGRPAHVPFAVYVAFVDTPEVTAAAARFRRLASFEVRTLDDDRYQASDGDGAQGFAQVLLRESHRRVILSQGEHTGAILGTIRGSALTVLDFETRGGVVDPTLTAYVRIDDPIAAAFARVLVPTFGFIADRKLAEGLYVTARVAEWAVDPSGGFCEWLAREPLPAAPRDRILAVVPSCGGFKEARPTEPWAIATP